MKHVHINVYVTPPPPTIISCQADAVGVGKLYSCADVASAQPSNTPSTSRHPTYLSSHPLMCIRPLSSCVIYHYLYQPLLSLCINNRSQALHPASVASIESNTYVGFIINRYVFSADSIMQPSPSDILTSYVPPLN